MPVPTGPAHRRAAELGLEVLDGGRPLVIETRSASASGGKPGLPSGSPIIGTDITPSGLVLDVQHELPD